ncbi:hypothetical protein JW933_02135 [candidate division FCPU426 bacterium]|nr:hypothetical protein [candidate division FCPU426 bacterium]
MKNSGLLVAQVSRKSWQTAICLPMGMLVLNTWKTLGMIKVPGSLEGMNAL